MDATDSRRRFLLELFAAGVHAARPARCLPRHLPRKPPAGRTLVLGAGKAAAAMAAVAARHLAGPVSGLVATRHGHGVTPAPPGIAVIEAGHPVPDAASAEAARRMLDLAAALTPRDRLVFLASGGGSSTAALPLPGLDMTQKQALVRHLVRSGASIAEINCLRKHVSAIKGGRLAAACGARDIRTYAISDVAGDDPAAIASGPTLPDPTTLHEAHAVLDRHGAPDRAAVLRVLAGPEAETPARLPGRQYCRVIASGRTALDAMATMARAAGYEVVDLGDRVEGAAAEQGRAHARLALELRAAGRRAVILSGGELTVRLGAEGGRGGPNLDYLAAMALALDGAAGISAIAGDSDGIDGSAAAAGATVMPDTLSRARAAGLDPAACLARHDSHALFGALGDLVVTGPTRTNVNDLRAIVVEGGD